MNKFMIDTYSGSHSGKTITKSYSAYGVPGEVNFSNNRKKSINSERDEAILLAKLIRDKQSKKKKEELDEQARNRNLFQKAAEMKSAAGIDLQKPTEPSENEEQKKIQANENPPMEQISDEELKQNIEMAKKLNESAKVKSLGTDATEQDILNTILNDIF